MVLKALYLHEREDTRLLIGIVFVQISKTPLVYR